MKLCGIFRPGESTIGVSTPSLRSRFRVILLSGHPNATVTPVLSRLITPHGINMSIHPDWGLEDYQFCKDRSERCYGTLTRLIFWWVTQYSVYTKYSDYEVLSTVIWSFLKDFTSWDFASANPLNSLIKSWSICWFGYFNKVNWCRLQHRLPDGHYFNNNIYHLRGRWNAALPPLCILFSLQQYFITFMHRSSVHFKSTSFPCSVQLLFTLTILLPSASLI